MTTNLVKLLDRVQELHTEAMKVTDTIDTRETIEIMHDYVPRLLTVIRLQAKGLNYIANSSPGPEQKFENENKLMAHVTNHNVEILLEDASE